jgi:hypothetical protein
VSETHELIVLSQLYQVMANDLLIHSIVMPSQAADYSSNETQADFIRSQLLRGDKWKIEQDITSLRI